jgi:two-component system sensor histidine kinase AtoS
MESGKPMVQKGELVRGSILNCMTPIIRDGEVIGYIWANVTLEDISQQMTKLNNQMFFLLILTFTVIYTAVVFTTQRFVGEIDVIRDGIQQVIKEPQHRLPHLQGELNMVVDKVNELSDSVALYKSYNRYVLSSVTNGVLAVTETGIIALANPSFRRLFHLDGREITGQRLSDLFDESLVDSIQSINDKGDSDEARTFTYEQKIFECYGNRIVSDSGRNLGNAYVLKDITVMRQYEKELQERERMVTLGEMGLNLAHEIKNPLTSVKGFTQLMQHRKIGEEQKQYYLGLMNEELERVNTLLNDMLTYGGRHKIHPEPVNLSELLEELKIIYQVTYPGVIFDLEGVDLKAPEIVLDRSKIIQLIDNLVKNSVDAGADHVRILQVRDDDSVRIRIRDNGSGIPEEIRDKVFTPFFTTKERGTGFGLSLCTEVASIHGGGLTVESESGAYTEFTLTLNPLFLESPDDD